VNGIDEATLAQRGRPFAEVCERLYEVAFGSLLAGQNVAAFDLPVLAAQAWRTGLPDTTPEHDDVIDTKLAWVAHLLGTERWPGESVGQLHGRLIATRTEAQSNLDFLCRQFGTMHAPAHDAEDDVAATDDLLRELHTSGIIRDVYGDDLADEVGEAYR
jgi:DNA polymerase III epsilon subunit-like protein